MLGWQLSPRCRGAAEPAPAAKPGGGQLSASAPSLRELLLRLLGSRTRRAVVTFGRRALCREDAFCVRFRARVNEAVVGVWGL